MLGLAQGTVRADRDGPAINGSAIVVDLVGVAPYAIGSFAARDEPLLEELPWLARDRGACTAMAEFFNGLPHRDVENRGGQRESTE